MKAELYLNTELIEPASDRKLITHVGIIDKTVGWAKYLVFRIYSKYFYLLLRNLNLLSAFVDQLFVFSF